MSGHETPESSRLRENRRYRLVAVGLYDIELAIADRLAETLRTTGWPGANRSLVIREALRRLNEDLLDKPAKDILAYFVDRQASRLTDRKTRVKE